MYPEANPAKSTRQQGASTLHKTEDGYVFLGTAIVEGSGMASNQANEIAAALDRLWERFLPEIRGRVEILEAAARAMANGELSGDQREQAAGAAHKLAGTLGTFGLAHGTQVARELERFYIGDEGLAPEIALSSAAELRELIEGRASLAAG
jgi:HPt (histidine-containing phosphotransfer) domain-containing protein